MESKATTPVWMVRAGKHGQYQDRVIDQNIAAIGWPDLPDLSGIRSKDELLNLIKKTYPDANPRTLSNWCNQVWAFLHSIKPGDLIVLPLKGKSAVAMGKCVSGYQYLSENPEDCRHSIGVQWNEERVPRKRFKQDLLDSLGAFLTVCRIRRNNAESRIIEVFLGKSDPGNSELITNRKTLLPTDKQGNAELESDSVEDSDAETDYEESLRDQIRRHIEVEFKNHDLSRLVDALLQAQGYVTSVSPPGADGGVDIIAGQGPLGFTHPRIAVQVKSGDFVCNSQSMREFKAAAREHGADSGVYICWNGFNREVQRNERKNFFEVRQWDSDELIEQILRHYDKFSESIRAELPLKRVWMLVREGS
ncbi:MAG: restriction endonuclease [Verrucomicrobiota bacterium]